MIVSYRDNSLDVTLVIEEPEFLLRFSPTHAVRITTHDAFQDPGLLERGLLELHNSEWLVGLASIAKKQGASVTFIENSHHFIVAGYDEVLEVAAGTVDIERARSAPGQS
jgi:hypothetical protein